MTDIRSELRGRLKVRWIATGLTAVVMLIVLAIAIGLLKKPPQTVRRQVLFDADSCVRLADVSRVYRIRKEPGRNDVLWFATAEGIRVLDKETLEWTRFGLDHGLPSETVSDIGFSDTTVWAATWSGVARFDRSRGRFEPLWGGDGPAGGRILAIECLGSGEIFFSADGRGVFRISGAAPGPERIVIDGLSSGSRITCLVSADSVLYIGTEGRRLFRYSRNGGIDEAVFAGDPSPKTLVWDVALRGGALWVATSDDGIWVEAAGSDSLVRLDDFPAKGAYCFAPEPDGLWCGTPFGLWRYHDDGEVWLQIVHPEEKAPTDFQVFTIENSGNQLWYGSMDLGAGFLKKDNVEWQPMRAGLSNPNVAAIAASDSVLWTGYGYQGGFIDRFTAGPVQYERNYSSMDGMVDQHIQSFLLRGTILYYGGYTSFGSVNMSSGVRRAFDVDSGLPHPDIAAICELSGDTLLLASQFGIVTFDTRSETFDTVPGTGIFRITAFHVAGDSVWFGTLARGLRVFDRRTRAVSAGLLGFAARIVAILSREDEAPGVSDSLYVVTSQSGLYAVDRRSGAARQVAWSEKAWGKASEYRNHVMTAGSIDGKIWLGTREAGFRVFDPASGAWGSVTYYDGLISDQARSLTQCGSYVWAGSYGGVSRFHKTYLRRVLER